LLPRVVVSHEPLTTGAHRRPHRLISEQHSYRGGGAVNVTGRKQTAIITTADHLARTAGVSSDYWRTGGQGLQIDQRHAFTWTAGQYESKSAAMERSHLVAGFDP
jgi:hypothetical protein